MTLSETTDRAVVVLSYVTAAAMMTLVLSPYLLIGLAPCLFVLLLLLGIYRHSVKNYFVEVWVSWKTRGERKRFRQSKDPLAELDRDAVE